jgi:hypothetical protein
MEPVALVSTHTTGVRVLARGGGVPEGGKDDRDVDCSGEGGRMKPKFTIIFVGRLNIEQEFSNHVNFRYDWLPEPNAWHRLVRWSNGARW